MIQEGVEIKHYKQWKTQRGEGTLVMPIEFINYVYSNGYSSVFEVDGVKYEGQIWRCKVNESIIDLPFRVAYIDSPFGETTLSVNKTPIVDNAPNICTDSWQEVYLGFRSRTLFPNLMNLKAYKEALEDLRDEFPKLVDLRIKLLTVTSNKELKSTYDTYLSISKVKRRKLQSAIYEILSGE